MPFCTPRKREGEGAAAGELLFPHRLGLALHLPEADTSTERSVSMAPHEIYGLRLPSAAQEPVTLGTGQTRHISDALKANPEVWCTADTDVRSPKEYHVRTCSADRLMFLPAAAQY